MFNTKSEILDILSMPYSDFLSDFATMAKHIHREQNGDNLRAVAMLGYDNICKNQCLYCGMRAGCTGVSRYRMSPEEVISTVDLAGKRGFSSVFLISGEDPKYGFDNLLTIVSEIKKCGFKHISLACGEYDRTQYSDLKSAGCDEYVMKFEMGQKEIFERLNPSTTFEHRMQCIHEIKELGMNLASGNIIDYPGQTLDMIAEDILLMQELQISWAPIIPYLPAKGTPLASEGGRGSLELCHKEISILRLSIPNVHITAQQPGNDLSRGLADDEGNLSALNCGADMLFCDLLTGENIQNFNVIDNRVTLGLEHIQDMAKKSGMTLVM